MIHQNFFTALPTSKIAAMVESAKHSVCFAGPGLQFDLAKAMVSTAGRIGLEMVTVTIDFDERVMRMGYGDIRAVTLLMRAGINIQCAPGLRTALIVVDGEGYVFSPIALYLETEPIKDDAPNAMRLSSGQVSQALSRLSPAAKAIAVAQAKTSSEKKTIAALAIDVASSNLTSVNLDKVTKSLQSAPPVQFDLARQVRVFEPYLQYVELSLTGASIQRHRLAIPNSIQNLGGNKDLENRLRTTFDLIERDGILSSKPLEDSLNEIRKNFTPSLGKDHGRVVLKAAKPHLLNRLAEFREKLKEYQDTVATNLQKQLDTSRQQVIEYYAPIVLESKPDSLLGQSLNGEISHTDACRWLDAELNKVFPKAHSLINDMKLEERFKNVTFETLNRSDFLEAVKEAFPGIDWDKAYKDFKAAGEYTQ